MIKFDLKARLLTLIWVLLFAPVYAQNQHRNIDIGLAGGPLLFFGDIGSMGNGYHIDFSAGISLGNNLSLSAGIVYGSFSDSDEGTPNSARDYAFETTTITPEVGITYTFFTQRGRGYTRKGLLKQWDKWSGQVFGYLAFPIYKVTPLRHLTPAILEKDHGVAPAISAGAALQYGISQRSFLRLMINPHYIFSDYLDGYTSENSSSNDIFHMVRIGYVYRMTL